eukprot:5826150-Amphidinium_carterae.2
MLKEGILLLNHNDEMICFASANKSLSLSYTVLSNGPSHKVKNAHLTMLAIMTSFLCEVSHAPKSPKP